MIYSIYPTNINLKIKIENNINFINYNDILKIHINECNNEQIIMHYENYYYYCENPICKDVCPILNETAICIKGFTENINNENSNYCKCLAGWKGNNCEMKDYSIIKYKN